MAYNFDSSPTEHIFGDSNILVREDEPSSIISYMLGSTFYNEKLHRKREMRMSKATAGASHIFNGGNEKEKVENADQISQQQETKPFFSEMFPETDERERPWKFCEYKGLLPLGMTCVANTHHPSYSIQGWIN